MSIWAYAIAALMIFVAGAGAAHKWDVGQFAIKENARLELVREQERASRATERQQATTVQEAVNESRKREIKARADASGAQSQLGRLRDTIALGPRSAASAAGSCAERTDPARELLGQCAAALTDLAAVADRLDSDRRTLMQAWPK